MQGHMEEQQGQSGSTRARAICGQELYWGLCGKEQARQGNLDFVFGYLNNFSYWGPGPFPSCLIPDYLEQRNNHFSVTT